MVGLPAGSGPEAFFSDAVKGSRACLPAIGCSFTKGPYFDYWNWASGKNRLQAELKWHRGSKVRKRLVPRPREEDQFGHSLSFDLRDSLRLCSWVGWEQFLSWGWGSDLQGGGLSRKHPENDGKL